MVRRFSAQLHIPGELQYPVEKNHSDIMKLVEGDSTYQTVVTHIKKTLESIKFPGESWVPVCSVLQYVENNACDRAEQATRSRNPK